MKWSHCKSISETARDRTREREREGVSVGQRIGRLYSCGHSERILSKTGTGPKTRTGLLFLGKEAAWSCPFFLFDQTHFRALIPFWFQLVFCDRRFNLRNAMLREAAR